MGRWGKSFFSIYNFVSAFVFIFVFVFSPGSKPSEQGDGEVGEVVRLRTSLVSRLQTKGLVIIFLCCFLQGVFFNWPAPEFARCWPVSN